MVVDVLSPCGAMSSESTVLAMQKKTGMLFHGLAFNLPAPFLCWKMTEFQIYIRVTYNKPRASIVNEWWRHQMETFSALLVLCVGNSPITRKIFPFDNVIMWLYQLIHMTRIFADWPSANESLNLLFARFIFIWAWTYCRFKTNSWYAKKKSLT